MTAVELKGGPAGYQCTLRVNGQKIPVRRAEITVDAQQLSEAKLYLPIIDGLDAELQASIVLDDATVKFLESLGWSQPA